MPHPTDAYDDAPMFAADAFRLSDAQADLIDKARGFGKRVLAPRAAQHDRDATFPIENFRDMRGEGLLSICIPKADGRQRRGFPDLLHCRGRARPLLRRDRAVVEHARVLDPVVGSARRRPADEPGGSRRSQRASRPALSPHHCRWRRLCAAVLGGRRRRGRHGRVRHRGAPRRGRLRRQRQEDFRLALGRRGLLRRALHRTRGVRRGQPAQHALSRHSR